jgi:cobalt-zinc-cadmium efflux system protein
MSFISSSLSVKASAGNVSEAIPVGQGGGMPVVTFPTMARVSVASTDAECVRESPRRPHASGVPARRSLALTIGLTAAIMFVEAAGGYWANSLSLLSDAGHMLTDVLALGMALFAISVALRPATARRTYGYYRVEILSALINGVLLVVISLAIFYEASRRFVHPEPVEGGLVLVVAAVGLLADLAGMWILSGSSHSVNVRSARLHVAGDALSSGGVLAGGIVIMLTSWYTIDALLSFAIGIVILVGAWRILKETVDILLESAPVGMEQVEVSSAIRCVPGIKEVHDLHIWSITSGMIALSGHVVLDAAALSCSDDVLNRIKEMLRERFDIEHTTIQVESESYSEVGEVH